MSHILGPAIHQCYIYPDFDAALARFAALGIGPFWVLHSDGGVARYRGEPHPLSMSAAFCYTGDTCFEIITPRGEQQSAYGEFLATNPQGGLHHLAWFSDDFAATLAQLEAAGTRYNVVQEFVHPATGELIEIYCEPVGVANPVLFQLVHHGPFDGWFDAMREAAATWDGSDPIRDARPLMAASTGKSAA